VLKVKHDYLTGDVDNSGDIGVSDVTYLTSFLFQNGAAPPIYAAADQNADGTVNVSDLLYLTAYLFNGGPQPAWALPD